MDAKRASYLLCVVRESKKDAFVLGLSLTTYTVSGIHRSTVLVLC